MVVGGDNASNGIVAADVCGHVVFLARLSANISTLFSS
jgi:hypothetical protein